MSLKVDPSFLALGGVEAPAPAKGPVGPVAAQEKEPGLGTDGTAIAAKAGKLPAEPMSLGLDTDDLMQLLIAKTRFEMDLAMLKVQLGMIDDLIRVVDQPHA